jgi:DNA-binding MurR/RpiR family transcriptional regulator
MDNAKELTSDQRRLVLWLATPENEREPKTLDALAAEVGVRPATIQRWRAHKLDVLAAEEAHRRLLEHLPGVYQTLASKAEDGSHEHIGLFMRVAWPAGTACRPLPPRCPVSHEIYSDKT